MYPDGITKLEETSTCPSNLKIVTLDIEITRCILDIEITRCILDIEITRCILDIEITRCILDIEITRCILDIEITRCIYYVPFHTKVLTSVKQCLHLSNILLELLKYYVYIL